MSCVFFFFKQKTAYEMRISDWSSDVCSSDLDGAPAAKAGLKRGDIVTKVGGKDVTPQQSLSYLIANVKPGARVPLEIIREGKRSEERRVGKECVSSVDLGGRRIIKKQQKEMNVDDRAPHNYTDVQYKQ